MIYIFFAHRALHSTWRPNWDFKVIVKGGDREVSGQKRELKRAIIIHSYGFPLMWLEDIPETPVAAESVPSQPPLWLFSEH